MLAHPSSINSANGIRTRVWALRGPRPSPLDDSAMVKWLGPTASTQQARQDSNLQPPVLETGALPLELRTSAPALPSVADRDQPGVADGNRTRNLRSHSPAL